MPSPEPSDRGEGVPDDVFTANVAGDPIGNVGAAPPQAYTGPPIRPLGLTIIMVLCLLFGVFGTLQGILGIGGLFLGDLFAEMAASSGDTAQARMQMELQETNRRFMIPNVLLLLGGITIAVSLVAGGAGIAMRRLWSVGCLRKAFLAAAVLEVIRVILAGFQQATNMPIMERYFRESSQQMPGFANLTTTFMWAGLVFWLVWATVKIGLMLWGRHYLGSPQVAGYFGAPSTDGHQESSF
ncbi:hypothetical protein [Crateriforma conspicua]|uniref:Uncharacterized protein n=1 Tax=Crateriforma conspicua TaxID=2527996 RepID=A0A5C5Y9J9_9PLAN|nr:hypothetical protein [Crateriforma conspicua]TWT72040.1 hypothetical protein Pan14r_43570 [Crateriforma conspicua]